MASTINSTTSGAGGLVTTGDSSNQLEIQTGGTTAITVASNQVLTLAQPLPIASGGTNATTASTALSNLGGVSTGKAIAMAIVFGG